MKILQMWLVVTLLVSAPSLAVAVSVEDVPQPRHHDAWVTDMADVIDPVLESKLNQLIGAAETDLGVEIAVVTVDSVDTPTPKDFATELFDTWGIGKSTKNNGLLVLLVLDARRLEMETGYGTETVLTDGWLKRMQETDMVPAFKEGRYGPGIYAGVEQSIGRLRTYAETGVLPEAEGGWSGSDSGGEGELPLLPVLFGLGGTALAGGGVWAARRRKYLSDRTCSECGTMMQMLPEAEDDVHLSPGQRTEERLGSVDWEYWFCQPCDGGKLLRVGKWLSGYGKYPACSHKTLSSTSSTITPATQYSTGLRESVEDCQHCDHYRRSTHVIPRLPEPSSTSSSSYSSGSSSGGGSFGGGSSGGGGAGSSW